MNHLNITDCYLLSMPIDNRVDDLMNEIYPEYLLRYFQDDVALIIPNRIHVVNKWTYDHHLVDFHLNEYEAIDAIAHTLNVQDNYRELEYDVDRLTLYKGYSGLWKQKHPLELLMNLSSIL